MNTEVKCSVANCHYWEQGNNCNAKQIIVEIDSHSSANLDTEFAAEAFTHQDRAVTSSETCCQTFKAK